MRHTLGYTELMGGQGSIGCAPMIFTSYIEDGNARLLIDGRYSFLFALKGDIKCYFRNYTIILREGSVVVVDKEQMHKCVCQANGVMLEYETVGRMSAIMKSVSEAFGKVCSEIVPFNDDIHQWCKALLVSYGTDAEKEKGFHRKACVDMVSLLFNYPQTLLGTLYIPLHACLLSCKSNKDCLMK